MQVRSIPFDKVSAFSDKDIRYTCHSDQLKSYIEVPFEIEGFGKLLDTRRTNPTDRQLLHDVVVNQYAGLSSSAATETLIDQLVMDNSFTVTTAHQPSLLTGPLYYPFKILSTINLAQKLGKLYPDDNFIPVFVLGAEDHDFEEINHFHIYGKKVTWQSDNIGATGRFSLDGLEDVIALTKEILGDSSEISDFMAHLEGLLAKAKNYGAFAFLLTHYLFDKFGLVILRMDDQRLKSAFRHIIKEEIFNAPSQALIEETQDALEKQGFGKQAHAREINFFYHCAQGRKRIIRNSDHYEIVDTDIAFTPSEMAEEIDKHPDLFSPNVVMRPLFQEYILPNLAYIGGGGELAYWLERKSQFAHFKINYPMLVRRNSAMLVTQRQIEQIEKLSLSIEDFMMPIQDLVKKYIEASDQPDFSLGRFKGAIANVFDDMAKRIGTIDPTLTKTAKAELAKAHKSVDYLESKLKKTIKQREEVQLRRIEKLKEKLFPGGGLQERYDGILEYLSGHGLSLLDNLLPLMDPFDKDFKVITIDS